MPRSATDIDRHVGERIRMRRVELAFGQERLGEALGVTFQQVQKYEHGTDRISAARLRAAADLLGVPIFYFYEDLTDAGSDVASDAAPEPRADAPPALRPGTPLEARLLRAFRSVPDAVAREHVVGLVERMAAGVPAAAE